MKSSRYLNDFNYKYSMCNALWIATIIIHNSSEISNFQTAVRYNHQYSMTDSTDASWQTLVVNVIKSF